MGSCREIDGDGCCIITSHTHVKTRGLYLGSFPRSLLNHHIIKHAVVTLSPSHRGRRMNLYCCLATNLNSPLKCNPYREVVEKHNVKFSGRFKALVACKLSSP
jgi:hypothetical protein